MIDAYRIDHDVRDKTVLYSRMRVSAVTLG
jgi:hypothetical protein